MSERKQPGLSTAGDSGYRRSGAARSSGRRSEGSSGGLGRTLGTNIMVALLLGGLVLAGWFIANQQQVLSEEQARVNDANERIERLEARLIATDSAMSQGGEDTKEQINLWESEIRKLWAVSNERNKKWIKDNERGVANLQSTLNRIEASNRDLQSAIDRHDAAFEQQQAVIDQLASLELQIQQIVRGQRDLVDKVNAANQSVASLRSSVSDKVDDNAEAVASMDAYRVALNSRIADLERRLNALAGAAGG